VGLVLGGIFLVAGGSVAAWLFLFDKASSSPTPVVEGPKADRENEGDRRIRPVEGKEVNPPRDRPIGQPPDRPIEPRPVVKFEAPPADLGIRPPALDGDKVVVPLPGPAANAAVGGGGRYLVLHLDTLNRLAVFDVNEARVVKEIALPAGKVLFAAGLEKLVVVNCTSHEVRRYSLKTFEVEKTAFLPLRDSVTEVVMGSASRGPLLVSGAQGVTRSELLFLDLETLEPTGIQKTGQGHIHIMQDGFVRASANGMVFGIWRRDSSPQGFQVLVVQGPEAVGYYQHDTVGHIAPGPDGQMLFTSHGPWSVDLKRQDSTPRQEDMYCWPACHGPYYLSMRFGDPSKTGPKPVGVGVHVPGARTPLAVLTDLELMASVNGFDREPFGNDKRILLIPDAKLLLTIPDPCDRLVLHRFDVREVANKAGKATNREIKPPPVVKFEAPPADLGIRPPALDGDKVVVPLPGPAANAAVGGGGRYLVLHLATLNRLAVFDVNEARVVKEIALPAGKVLFAAGLDKLVVVNCTSHEVRRYSLKTFEVEKTAFLPLRDSVTEVVMGSASRGPLLVADAQGAIRSDIMFLDLDTLEPTNIKKTGPAHIHIMQDGFVRASADGRVFGIWLATNGAQTLVLSGEEARSQAHADVGHVTPGLDGQAIFSAKGLWTADFKPLGNNGPNDGLYCWPACHGPYYLSLRFGDVRTQTGLKPLGLCAHTAGDNRKVADLSDVELMGSANGWDRERFGNDKRVLLVPEAKLILTIPDPCDRLVLRRFDVEQAKAKQ
jgi:hypothetical protein